MPSRIDIRYQTLSLPPPYSYVYTLHLEPTPDALRVHLDWQYTDRDELTEEEIGEEGFTPDDDFRWQGTLPPVWVPVVLAQAEQTSLVTDPPPGDSELLLTLTNPSGAVTTGVPREAERWEYLLQELIQGVYEVAERELPFRMRYRSIPSAGRPIDLTLEAHFAQRRFTIMTEASPLDLPWTKLRPVLEALSVPDYHPDRARTKAPRQPGQYLHPGDGWYPLGQAVTNPGKTDALGHLRRTVENLLSQNTP